MVKISVITWNGGFRESFHTVDFFAEQAFPSHEYEFIWAEYYGSAVPELEEKINRMGNAKIVYVGGEGEWHAGRCMNAGIAVSSGELLVIVDGDIVVKPDFLAKMWQAHTAYDNLVLYVRRWDEPEATHGHNISAKHLEEVCRLANPTNYGGCLAIRRKTIEAVNGYEEHVVFSGSGALSMELYTRLRNAGLPIIWHPMEKVFHPRHEGTLPSTSTLQQRKQAWVIKCRSLNLDAKADKQQVQTYLEGYSDEHATSTQEKLLKLQERNTQLQERNTQLQERNTQLQERNTQLQERNAQLQERNAQLQAEIDQQIAQLNQIHNSWSWKITAPLRKALEILTFRN